MPSQQQEQKPVGQGDLNVLGGALEGCSCEPMTGWFRDGHCRTDPSDLGQHSVCCVMSERFLNYSKAQGNDLSTPMPDFGFPGLKPGDHWCVCAPRWKQAYDDGMAPPVRLEATEHTALQIIPLDILKKNAHQLVRVLIPPSRRRVRRRSYSLRAPCKASPSTWSITSL